MLDWIKEFLTAVGSHLKPWVLLTPYECAGIMRLGHYNRTVGPGGFYWKIPFIEQVLEITTCVTTVRLPAQYLTTKDNVQVALAAIVRYKIVDVKPYVCDIFDQHDVLCDVTMGAIRKHIAEAVYADLVENPPEEKVASAARRKVKRYGFEIEEVTFTSFTRARPLMLITQQVLTSLDN